MAEHPLLFRQPEATRARKRRVQSDYRAAHREEVNARKRAAYWADPSKAREQRRQTRERHYEKNIAANRIWHRGYRARIRAEMIRAYGSKCECCGEAQPLFLQLDHRDNDGHAERRIHKTTNALLVHLRKLGWPKERHALLCANCNFGRALNGGKCPHHG